MEITEKMIERFLNGRGTPAEADVVFRYFRKNPDAWKKYLIDYWDEEGSEEELPASTQELMLEEIRKKTYQANLANSSRGFIRIGLRFGGVAASVLLVIAGVWLSRHESKNRKYAAHSVVHADSNQPDIQTGNEWKLNANHTDQKLKMKLEDGSVVTLFPHSNIRYARHFTDNEEHKRDIYLQGQAFFDVTRDKSRPFTVYAGNMSTTVLGTSFSVQENETGVLVKLYCGKVRVHPVKRNTWNEDIFLKPGEQLRYDNSANLATVTNFVIDKPAQKLLNAGMTDDRHNMMFDNTALPEVINRLIRHYRIPIFYNKAELSDMYFSGQVLESDSLSIILKVIANMNGLQITQTTDGFTVHPFKE